MMRSGTTASPEDRRARTDSPTSREPVQTERLTIERLSYGTDAIAHRPDGKTVFVQGGCPGDVVDVQVTSEKKGFATGRIVTVAEPSPSRVPARCPYHAICGGCPWQHVSYETQLAQKREAVSSALVRIGGFSPDLIEPLMHDTAPSGKQWGYRNKIELEAREVQARGGSSLQLGMHADGGDFTRIDSCLLLGNNLSKVPKALSGALRYLQGTEDLGIVRVGLRTSERTHETELAIWTATGGFPRGRAASILKNALRTTSLVRVLLKGTAKERFVSGVETISGNGNWTEQVCDTPMTFSAPSFFQVNTSGAEKLIDIVMAGLDVHHGETVYDLYSGAGTFTIPLAQRTDDVVAIESFGSSVKDLRRNIEESDAPVDVIGGDVARELPSLSAPNKAVVDPPRAGLSVEAVDALCEKRIGRLAYVSCDPATLARDLKLLTRDVYTIEQVHPVDLFPQTFHVETVVILSGTR